MISTLSKNDVRFFDLLKEASEDGDSRKKKMVQLALQAFLNKPRVEVRKKVQALTSVSTDFAKLTSDAFNVTIAEVAFDLGWQRAFKDVPVGAQGTWDIYDVQNGLTFRLIPEGSRIRVEGLSGSLVTAHVDYYGGALGWTDRMIRYRQVAAMLDMASIFRNRFWSNKADNHYLLLATAAALNVTTWQGVGTDPEVRRDVLTLNEAAFVLTDRCKDKGYGDMAAVQLVLYANPRDRARILAAMAASPTGLTGVLTGGLTVNWNIQVVYTFNSNVVARRPILVIPGNKLQAAEDLAPTTFTAPKDPLTLNEVQAVWSIYGAVVADTDQCQQLRLV